MKQTSWDWLITGGLRSLEDDGWALVEKWELLIAKIVGLKAFKFLTAKTDTPLYLFKFITKFKIFHQKLSFVPLGIESCNIFSILLCLFASLNLMWECCWLTLTPIRAFKKGVGTNYHRTMAHWRHRRDFWVVTDGWQLLWAPRHPFGFWSVKTTRFINFYLLTMDG